MIPLNFYNDLEKIIDEGRKLELISKLARFGNPRTYPSSIAIAD